MVRLGLGLGLSDLRSVPSRVIEGLGLGLGLGLGVGVGLGLGLGLGLVRVDVVGAQRIA